MDLKAHKLLFLLILAANPAFAATPDYQVYPIEPFSHFEPSGLTIKDGHLYTVSDAHPSIYKIELSDGVAHMVPQIDIDVTTLGALNLDLEGITHDGEHFYVVSEAHHRLIKVNSDGQAQWMTHDGSSFYPEANKDGLFQVFNAALEALTYLGEGRFLLAAERQPRGLIEAQFDENGRLLSQTNHVLDQSVHKLTKNRKPDLTGLYFHDGEVYALHRNAELIHRWVKNDSGQFEEIDEWSFAHIVNHPAHAYQDMTYGHAEGLAVDDEHFYVILDNNGVPKSKQGNDKRPLLIVIKR